MSLCFGTSLGDSFDHKRLWSSSTTSTHFDVTVVKSETLPDEMATTGVEISEQDLLDAGPSSIQASSARTQQGEKDGTADRSTQCLLCQQIR